jgi:hypothetical protein
MPATPNEYALVSNGQPEPLTSKSAPSIPMLGKTTALRLWQPTLAYRKNYICIESTYTFLYARGAGWASQIE